MQEQFVFESRWSPEAHAYHGQVACTCRKCHRTDWLTAKNPGWGRRLFKEKGWLLGPNRNRDVCPSCLAQRPTSDKPMSGAQKRAAYLAIERRAGALPPPKKRDLFTEAAEPAMQAADPSLLEPSKMAEALAVLGTVTVATPKNPPKPGVFPFREPDAAADRTRNPRKKIIASRGFTTNTTAYGAASRWFKREHGIDAVTGYHYKLTKADDGTFGWEVLPFDPAAPAPAPVRYGPRASRVPKAASFATEHAADTAARRFLHKMGVQGQRHLHYLVWHDPTKHAWAWRVRTDAEIAMGKPAAPAPAAPAPAAPLLAATPAPAASGKKIGRPIAEAPGWKDYLRGMPQPTGEPRREGYSSSWSAARSAWNWLRSDDLPDPINGRDYETYRDGDSWSWREAGAAAPAPITYTPRELHWVMRAKQTKRTYPVCTHGFASSSTAKRAAFITLYRRGVTDHPRLNVHYRIEQRDDGWAWMELTTAQTPAQQPSTLPPPETPVALAEPPKTPTRAEFRAILDFLDANYDTDKEHWRGDMNDAKAAEKLKLPRAWITGERERAFGPDVSERDGQMAAKQRADLIAEAGALAEATLTLAAAVEAFRAKLEKNV